MFSLRPVLPGEQILSTIYGKSGILHNYDGCGGGHGFNPAFRVGVLSSILELLNLCFGGSLCLEGDLNRALPLSN